MTNPAAELAKSQQAGAAHAEAQSRQSQSQSQQSQSKASKTALAARLQSENRAVIVAVLGVVVGFAIGFFQLSSGLHALSGQDSVGYAAAFAASLVSGAAFFASYALNFREKASSWRAELPLAKRLIDSIGLSIVHGAIAYLTLIAASELFQQGFAGLEIDGFAGASMVAVTCGLGAYVAFLSGSSVGTTSLSILLAVFLISGTAFSMVTANESTWWQVHFSELGTLGGVAAWAFNLTLVFSGIVVTTLATYVTRDLQQWVKDHSAGTRRRVQVIQWLLAAIGILLAIVGLVPTDLNFWIHLGAASGMVLVFFALIAALAPCVPGLTKVFLVMSYLIVAAIIFAALLWMPFGYYNLTGLEFAVAGLIFVWLVVFVRQVGALVDNADDEPEERSWRPVLPQRLRRRARPRGNNSTEGKRGAGSVKPS
ncbi:DUF998 domain-containing protein [Humidisolicoccus flavus]|uniref:DUF998 domain-containing protein n=1 Tax=Humidisolicoccus flavus TaxID=3111414 RepID=UPI0032450032